ALEHAVGRALQRQVDVLADLGRLGHGGDHLGREVDRIRRREADALDAVDGGDGAQQVGEAGLLPAVRADRLAEQLHLLVAGGGHRARLAQHLARGRAALAPARVRDHAEGAELVAAALDGDVAGDGARARARHRARRVQPLVGLEAIEARVLDLVAAAGAVDVVQQAAVAVGADHDVDVRRLGLDAGLEVLGHAAGDAQHHPGARLVARQHAGAGVDLLLGLLAHGAGVEQDQIRARRIVGARVARAVQQAQHHVAVRDVHLAAVGLEVHAGTVAAARDGDRAVAARALDFAAHAQTYEIAAEVAHGIRPIYIAKTTL